MHQQNTDLCRVGLCLLLGISKILGNWSCTESKHLLSSSFPPPLQFFQPGFVLVSQYNSCSWLLIQSPLETKCPGTLVEFLAPGNNSFTYQKSALSSGQADRPADHSFPLGCSLVPCVGVTQGWSLGACHGASAEDTDSPATTTAG